MSPRVAVQPPVQQQPLIVVGAPQPRNARHDPDSGMRFYTWEGVDYPSVTTLRRMAGLPHGLHQWAVNKVIDRAIGSADSIATRLATATDHDSVVKVLRHELRLASTEERDRAAAIGTAVHDAAATRKTPDQVEDALRPRLAQYHDWLAASGVQVLASEFQCWSPSVGYAGTADLLVQLPNGRIFVVDIKTGKGVWSEHALQVIAYANADFVGNDDVIDEERTRLLRAADGIAVLHLANDHWEFRALRKDAETWRAFRGLLLFAVWIWKHPDADSVTVATRSGKA